MGRQQQQRQDDPQATYSHLNHRVRRDRAQGQHTARSAAAARARATPATTASGPSSSSRARAGLSSGGWIEQTAAEVERRCAARGGRAQETREAREVQGRTRRRLVALHCYSEPAHWITNSTETRTSNQASAMLARMMDSRTSDEL